MTSRERANAWLLKNGVIDGQTPVKRAAKLRDTLADEFYMVRGEALDEAQGAIGKLPVR